MTKTYEERKKEAFKNYLEYKGDASNFDFSAGAEWARGDTLAHLIEQAGDLEKAIDKMADQDDLANNEGPMPFIRGAKAIIPILQAAHEKEIERVKFIF